MLDLSAAFDTVDHNILIRRLETSFGITGPALEWFRSYLRDRSMKVCINGAYSEAVGLESSVPQGSQIAPELYSNYTQPLGQLLRAIQLQYHCYADGTQLMTCASLSDSGLQQNACHILSSGIEQSKNG